MVCPSIQHGIPPYMVSLSYIISLLFAISHPTYTPNLHGIPTPDGGPILNGIPVLHGISLCVVSSVYADKIPPIVSFLRRFSVQKL